jgi:hypothetical protein
MMEGRLAGPCGVVVAMVVKEVVGALDTYSVIGAAVLAKEAENIKRDVISLCFHD